MQNFLWAIRMRFIEINARDVFLRRWGDSMLYSFAAGGNAPAPNSFKPRGVIAMVTRSARRRVLYAILTTTLILAGQGPLDPDFGRSSSNGAVGVHFHPAVCESNRPATDRVAHQRFGFGRHRE